MPKEIHKLSAAAIDFLNSVVGEDHISEKGVDLDQHAQDQSFHAAHRPAVVVWPASSEEISQILRYANEHLIPVTPWGAGTSLEGNPIPLFGGIVLDMSRMDKILKIHSEDFQVDVQAGALYQDMNGVLARQGLFFAPDPGANASIGGMIANNAAGTRTLRYGTTKDNVLRLEVVLSSGEIIHMGTRAAKTSSGYDLLHLFIGSEGTLGVACSATLKLATLPEKFSAVVASFPGVEKATQAVTQIMGSGIIPAALEFLSAATVEVLNSSDEFELPAKATLLMEFHSASKSALDEELALVREFCDAAGCLHFEAGLGRAERDRLWRVRHQSYDIIMRNNPGRSFVIMDVAVPVSHYSRIVRTAERTISEHGLHGYLVGHAGDGNLHPLIPYIPGDEDSYALAEEIEKSIVEAAIEMDGTATGEHGVGIGKRRFMAKEHGTSLDTMQAIKAALDPNDILNPGKIFGG